MDETTARGSWGCGAAPCFPSGMGRWQPDTLPAARKTVGHPEYKYAQPSMWLVAKPCRSQLNLWSQCCTTDRGGLGSEIHLQGVMSLWLRMGPYSCSLLSQRAACAPIVAGEGEAGGLWEELAIGLAHGSEHPQFSPLSAVTWTEILSSSRSLLSPLSALKNQQ